jgi:hypothetical protein
MEAAKLTSILIDEDWNKLFKEYCSCNLKIVPIFFCEEE